MGSQTSINFQLSNFHEVLHDQVLQQLVQQGMFQHAQQLAIQIIYLSCSVLNQTFSHENINAITDYSDWHRSQTDASGCPKTCAVWLADAHTGARSMNGNVWQTWLQLHFATLAQSGSCCWMCSKSQKSAPIGSQPVSIYIYDLLPNTSQSIYLLRQMIHCTNEYRHYNHLVI